MQTLLGRRDEIVTEKPAIIAFPLDKLQSILEELDQATNMTRTLLKWYVTETDLEGWDESAIPLLMDIHASANKLDEFLMSKLKNPTPEELLISAAMGISKDALPFHEEEVMMISGALTMIDQNKMTLRAKFNISFEVH